MSVDDAKQLLLEWFEYSGGNPWVGDTTDYGHPDTCFFCSGYRERAISSRSYGHEETCLYIRIAKLLGKEIVP